MTGAPANPPFELRWIGDVHAGMSLEITSRRDGIDEPVARIVADRDESLWFELVLRGEAVRIPVSLLKEAIVAAEKDVHPDAWHDLRDELGDEDA